MRYDNPVIPGFHPDPSICRVGRDYYLVTSSFEYFPGVPVFHSRDLVHWRRLGYCLTRRSQLDLAGCACSDGIWAPTIRHHEGTFYMVTTLVRRDPFRARNFFVTATDPAGPWSEPVWLDEGGIDPDLFFGEAGTVHYSRTGEVGIWSGEVDVETGRIVRPLQQVWAGTGGAYPEGPHLYRIDGVYYLMVAEGGTGYGHMETIARAESPCGPFEPCPRNPILTHRDRPEHPIQCTGHADLVQAHDGSWWMVFLGVRDRHPGVHSFHLGRETFLAPVRWDEEGWPTVGRAGRVELQMDGPDWEPHPWPAPPARDDFDDLELGPRWNTLRLPLGARGSLFARPGWLRLHGTEWTLDDTEPVAFLGRRQTHMNCRATTRMDFHPADDGDEAGLTVLMRDTLHYEMALTRTDGERQVIVRRRVKAEAEVVGTGSPGAGPVELHLDADRDTYEFAWSGPDGIRHHLAQLPVADIALSSDADAFTGLYIGLYATGNGRPCSVPADFDWFELHAG
ncbi:MAG: glycoside hydrolase family 43 protein [Candidatus Brocadiia bacterium]